MPIRLLFFIGCFYGVSTAGCATPHVTDKEKPGMQESAENKKPQVLFVLHFTPGPNWLPGKPPIEQPGISGHMRNLEKWAAAGQLNAGGPFLDSKGGMALLSVKTLEEAQRLAAEDPAVQGGLLLVDCHPWLVAISK